MLSLPGYLLVELLQWLGPLEAAEQQAAVEAAIVPHATERDQNAVWRRLAALADRLLPQPEPEPVTIIREDPEAAAAWFAEQGVRVIDG